MRKLSLIAAMILVLPALAGTALADDDLFLLQDACVKCHLTAERTTRENSVVAWRESVHYRPDSGCADCHGGDKMMYLDFKKGHMGVPDAAGTVALCGQCHEREAHQFIYDRPQKACTASCLHCHGAHRTGPADFTLINADNCGACHDPKKAAQIIAAMADAQARFKAVRQTIKEREASGIPMEVQEKRLDDLRQEVGEIFHTLPPGQFPAALAQKAYPGLDALNADLAGKSPKKRNLEGLAVVGFLVLAAGLVILRLVDVQKR